MLRGDEIVRILVTLVLFVISVACTATGAGGEAFNEAERESVNNYLRQVLASVSGAREDRSACVVSDEIDPDHGALDALADADMHSILGWRFEYHNDDPEVLLIYLNPRGKGDLVLSVFIDEKNARHIEFFG